MTKNQKILVGLGIGALVVYVFTKMGKKAQTATGQAQSQDNKGQNPPTRIEKPQRGQTYEEVVRSGGGGIKIPNREPSIIPSNRVYSNYYGGMMDSKEEVEYFESAYKKKYAVGGKPMLGDTINTQFGVYKFTAPESRGNSLARVVISNRWVKK
jgi:hypothetical protein